MTLKKKHIKILKEASEVGEFFSGFNHREHRTNIEPSGKKRVFNRKKEKINELRNEDKESLYEI